METGQVHSIYNAHAPVDIEEKLFMYRTRFLGHNFVAAHAASLTL
jgi:hypothetical protein